MWPLDMKISHNYEYRIKYSETDMMGFVHHSNYARLYENARWELMRKLGIPYSEIEKQGIFMPVVSIESKFIKPLFYDDEIVIKTKITKLPTIKVEFEYNILSKSGNLLNSATVVCAFIDSKTQKVMRAPSFFINRLNAE